MLSTKQELIKRLEIRKQQLLSIPQARKYDLNQSHHLRDIVTILAYLQNSKNVNALIRNLPREEDRPKY
jgi:hypothetical protein